MKKMFIALGIAFALFCAAITPNFNAYAGEYRAEQAKLDAIVETFKDQYIERYGEDNFDHVYNIEVKIVSDCVTGEDIVYKVDHNYDEFTCTWTMDADEVEF